MNRWGWQRSKTRKLHRRQSGSVIVTASLCAFVMIILAMVLGLRYQLLIFEREAALQAVQNAAIGAARELGSIVIADPYFGFASLADLPAVGRGTLAPDGEPLPVNSINTITGNVRLEKLLAQKIGSEAFAQVAEDDYREYMRLKSNMQTVLAHAVSPTARPLPHDVNDKEIKVYQTAYETFVETLPILHSGNARIKSFTITLGWLESGSTTETPQAERKPLTSGGEESCYPSFVNVPVGKDSFYFAGVSEQVRLVESARFRPADKLRLSCCIMIKAEIEIGGKQKPKPEDHNTDSQTIVVRAAALPASMPNCCAPGTLAIYLPQGNVENLTSLADLVNQSEITMAKGSHAIAKGDFPCDSGSNLIVSTDDSFTAARAVSHALVDWLRSNNARPRLKSVIEALNYPLRRDSDFSICNQMITFATDSGGEIQVNYIDQAGFMRKTVADGQTRDVAFNTLATSKGNLCLDIRDEVSNTGTDLMSKHGGQPITGELPGAFTSFLCEDDQQKLLDRVKGPMRESYLKGGLAVAFELYFNPTF